MVGLYLLGVIPMPWSGPGQVNMKRKGLLAAFILGLVFGIALGPCTFAYMAPMLGVTFNLAKTAPFTVRRCSWPTALGIAPSLCWRARLPKWSSGS